MKEEIVISKWKNKNEDLVRYTLNIEGQEIGIQGNLKDLSNLFNAIWVEMMPKKEFWARIRLECPTCKARLRLVCLTVLKTAKTVASNMTIILQFT